MQLLKTLTLAAASIGLIILGLALPPRIGLSFLGFLALVATIYFVFHSKYRYFRLAASTLATWAGARAMPSLFVVGESVETTFTVFFDSSVPWSFDCAVAIIVSVLLLLDDRLRNGEKIVRSSFVSFSHWLGFNFNHQSGGDNSVQLQVASNGHNSPVTVNNYGTAKDDFNALIDAAASFLKEEQPDVTIAQLTEIRRHHWDELSPRERYRVYANLGHAYSRKDMQVESSEHFIKAATFEPLDEAAMNYHAAALYAMDALDEAKEKAEAAIALHPLSELSHSVLIRIDRSSVTTTDLYEKVPVGLRNSVEVLFGLYSRAMQNQEVAAAEEYARRIKATAPNEPRHNEYLGAALAQKAVMARQGVLELDGSEIDQTLLEADGLLSQLIEKDELPCRQTIGRARFHRAIVRSFQHKDDLAENDFREAVRLLPTDRQVGHQFGLFMCNVGKVDEALHLFAENAASSVDPGPTLMHARLLGQRKAEGDVAAAIRSLESELDDLPNYSCRDQFDFAETLCGLLLSNDEKDRAEQFLANHRELFSLPMFLTLSAEVDFRSGFREQALQSALNASKEITNETPIVCRHFLAYLLALLEQHAEALAVFRDFIKPCAFDWAMHRALDCAREAEDHQFILEFCPQLRHTGNATPFTIETEVGTLEIHSEFDAAIEIIDEYLANPKDGEFAKKLRVRRSILGMRLNRPELVETDLSQLPHVDTVPPKFGCIVASILAEAGKHKDAAQYAYQLFRNHPDESEVHKCVGTLMGIGNEAECPFPAPDVVETDSAVRYRETKSEVDQWLIIEDECTPKRSLNEIAPDSFLGIQLVGQNVGHEFSLRKEGIQERKAKITGIFHKFEYRKFDCLHGFENRFHDEFLCTSYEFPTLSDGTPDVSSFLESIKQLNKPIEELDAFTRDTPISVAAYATIARRSILATVFHFGAAIELPIRCCRGTDGEFLRAEAVLSEGRSFVADPTALATMFAIEAYKYLPQLPPGFLVSHGTLDYFQQIARQPHEVLKKRFHAIQRGRMSFASLSGEDRKSPTDELNDFCDWIRRNFEVNGGRGAAEIPVEKRKELESMFGRTTLESVGLTYAESAVLWTDDFAVSDLVQDELVVHRVWTDVLAEHFEKTGVLPGVDLQEAKLRLIELGYTFTRLSFDCSNRALRQSKWDCKDGQFVRVLDWLNTSGVQALGAIQHAAHILRYAWQNAPLAHQRTQITDGVAGSLAKRPDGLEVLNLLHGSLDDVFPVEILAQESCQRSIEKQIRLLSRKRLLILPDDPEWRL